MLLTYTQSYTDTYAGKLRNCRIDLANWSQMAGQTECQRKACLQSFWRGVQARASWGRRGTQWDMLRVRRLHIDHARLRSSAVRLSRCLQTGVSRKEGDKLVDESRSLLPQLRAPHQGPCSWWVLTVLSLGLFKRSHYHTCSWRPCMEDTSCWHWNTVFVTDWGGSGEGITKNNDSTGDQAMDACMRPFVSPRKELRQLLT